MVETCIRSFVHVGRRLVEAPIKRVKKDLDGGFPNC